MELIGKWLVLIGALLFAIVGLVQVFTVISLSAVAQLLLGLGLFINMVTTIGTNK